MEISEYTLKKSLNQPIIDSVDKKCIIHDIKYILDISNKQIKSM